MGSSDLFGESLVLNSMSNSKCFTSCDYDTSCYLQVIDWKENIITTIDSLYKEHSVEVSILRYVSIYFIVFTLWYLNIRSLMLDMVEKRTWKQKQNTVCSLLISNIVFHLLLSFRQSPFKLMVMTVECSC